MMSTGTIFLLSLVLILTFTWSIGEKLIDSNGYQHWLKQHFKNTVVLPYIKPLFYLVIVLELLATILLINGLVEMFLHSTTRGIYFGSLASFSCLIVLLIGQRIAKDYQSAANLIVYLLLSIFTFYLADLSLNS